MLTIPSATKPRARRVVIGRVMRVELDVEDPTELCGEVAVVGVDSAGLRDWTPWW
jgi:hypothetical protein